MASIRNEGTYYVTHAYHVPHWRNCGFRIFGASKNLSHVYLVIPTTPEFETTYLKSVLSTLGPLIHHLLFVFFAQPSHVMHF
jgi:hypothetical protein